MIVSLGGVLLHYRLISSLEEKRLPRVWKALDLSCGRPVALKLVPSAVSTSEIEALTRLSGISGVVPLLQVTRQVQVVQGCSSLLVDVLAFELCENGDLHSAVTAASWTTDDSALRCVFLDIARAVLACHERNVAHRDITLENVLLASDRRAVLADFGCAACDALEASPAICGTRGFAAPEALAGDQFNAKAADVFALGVVLFAMKAKARPFQSHHQLLVLNDDPESFWKHAPRLVARSSSPSFRSLFQRMVRVCPEERLTIDEVLTHPWVTVFCERACKYLYLLLEMPLGFANVFTAECVYCHSQRIKAQLLNEEKALPLPEL